MSDKERLVDFIHSIPLDTNPYDAVIEYLEALATPPSLPHWARRLLKFFLACYVLMWLQSFYLLYVRFKTRMFRLITVTRLGLWRVDVPNMSGLAYFLYPPMVIADLLLQQQIDLGKRDLTNKIPIFACKFLVILTASWAFIWVCACQCLTNYWDEQWSEAPKNVRRIQLPRYVVITMNILFVVVLTWIIPFVIYFTTRSNEEYKEIKHILGQVIATLETYRSIYDPNSYQPSTLIIELLPAQDILAHEERMTRALRTALIIGLANLILLCLFYAPLLKSSIGAIQRRTEECTFTVAISPFEQSEQFAHIKHRLRQEYWTSFIHGLAVYLTVLVLVPIMIWQVSFPGPLFLRSSTWLTVTQIGMHGPFAISGNAIELLLNMQARRLLDIYRIQKNATRAISRNGSSHLHLEGGSSNSDLGVSDVPPLSPPSLHGKVMELQPSP